MENILCPFCHEPMQAGAILGDRYALKWQPEDQPLVMGIWATGHKIGKWYVIGRPRIFGHRCANCNKIIVDG